MDTTEGGLVEDSVPGKGACSHQDQLQRFSFSQRTLSNGKSSILHRKRSRGAHMPTEPLAPRELSKVPKDRNVCFKEALDSLMVEFGIGDLAALQKEGAELTLPEPSLGDIEQSTEEHLGSDVTDVTASSMKLCLHLHSRRGSRDEPASSPQPQLQPQSKDRQPCGPRIPSPEEEERDKRRASMYDARDFIHDAISNHDRWAPHVPSIRINCPYTLVELHALGFLPQFEGVPACRKLVRVPVIHDELGLFLWTHLAALARRPSFAQVAYPKAGENTRYKPMNASLAGINESFCFDKPAPVVVQDCHYKPSKASFADIDENFRFGKPSPVAARERTEQCSDSPTSWRRASHACNFCPHNSIEECREQEAELDEIHSEALEATRGKVVNRSGRSLPPLPPTAECRRGYLSVDSNDTRASTLDWYREHGTDSSASSVHKTGSHLAGRLGSVVRSVGSKIGGVLSANLFVGYGYYETRTQEPTSSSVLSWLGGVLSESLSIGYSQPPRSRRSRSL